MDKFTATYAPYAQDNNFSVQLVNGGINDQTDTTHDSGEANLDIQYAIGMSYKTPVTYFSTAGRGPLVPDPEYDAPPPPPERPCLAERANMVLPQPARYRRRE